MTQALRPPSLDPVAAARWQALLVQAAQSPWLHEEVASRMQERLDFIKLQPLHWVHWGPLRGGLAAQSALEQRYPKAQVWLAGESPGHAQFTRQALQAPWWQARHWRGPNRHEGLPPDHTAHMLWANMHLHASAEPQALLQTWHRALAVDGFLMFSCLGPDTLRDLRQVYARAGWPEPAHAFTDMHDWGDMLVEAGFAEPVMDMERITLTYASPDALLAELRSLGRNLHLQRFQGLRTRRWRDRLSEALLALARPEEGGRLSLGFEIVYGHALKPQPRMKMAAKTEIGLDQMRHMLHSGGGIGGKV
ncbi:biotin synthase [Limnohabitans sp. Bal53]|uniref:biotin synthase n=1 Tax=Limnohabitans sp. Bal53 TaxID=1977910 RepID=UPI000D3D65ED|nr:biotin synthase [Limnohabitans sp. Bal53]PUE40766.1 biotin synthase [Limnohabitans sp. Bal53]